MVIILIEIDLVNNVNLSLLEKDLLQELQKCRRTTKPSTASASGGSLSKKLSFSTRLDIHFKNIEDERDMYKNEVELLQKLFHERSRTGSPSRLRGRSVSPSAATRLANRRENGSSSVIPYVKRSASSCSTSPTRCTVCGLNRNRSSPTRVKRKKKGTNRRNFVLICFSRRWIPMTLNWEALKKKEIDFDVNFRNTNDRLKKK